MAEYEFTHRASHGYTIAFRDRTTGQRVALDEVDRWLRQNVMDTAKPNDTPYGTAFVFVAATAVLISQAFGEVPINAEAFDRLRHALPDTTVEDPKIEAFIRTVIKSASDQYEIACWKATH